MSIKYRRLMIILIGCIILFLFSCASSSQLERKPITPESDDGNAFYETDYLIKDYTVYSKDIGICDKRIIITYFSTTETRYGATVYGCDHDPYYYVQFNDEYITLNEAADLGLFNDEEVINEFVNVIK